MLIDCDRCPGQGVACAGCVVTALFETPPGFGDLGSAELHVIEVLARAGIEATVIGDGSGSARGERGAGEGTRRGGGRRRTGWEGAA
jgi:hypothetical protein